MTSAIVENQAAKAPLILLNFINEEYILLLNFWFGLLNLKHWEPDGYHSYFLKERPA
jgi:hypothetical protein